MMAYHISDYSVMYIPCSSLSCATRVLLPHHKVLHDFSRISRSQIMLIGDLATVHTP